MPQCMFSNGVSDRYTPGDTVGTLSWAQGISEHSLCENNQAKHVLVTSCPYLVSFPLYTIPAISAPFLERVGILFTY